MSFYEVNFDGLVGPTHNYAGLSSGNVASTNNAGDISSPKKAALQGLEKAKSLMDLGFKQGLLPPHARPDFEVLKKLGFSGSENEIIKKASAECPEILAACYSSSAMWTANAGTVSPSPDTKDGKVHFTAANLNCKFHRSIEPAQTSKILKATFNNEDYFTHHDHLPENTFLGDEGAANHTRFSNGYGKPGVELFVFGKYGFNNNMPAPKKFIARQTFEASQAIARLHGLGEKNTVFAQQNPDVIDLGVFHNDVISVGNQNTYFCHEKALLNTNSVISEIQAKLNGDFHFIQVPESDVSVQDAVSSYLFNSQLIGDGTKMSIVVPKECQENSRVWAYLQKLISMDNPINETLVYDVKESMKNGGGPACLRLRVTLSEFELAHVNSRSILTNELYTDIKSWINKHYREQISPSDLADPKLVDEVRVALDELTQIMKLGSIYPFQIS